MINQNIVWGIHENAKIQRSSSHNNFWPSIHEISQILMFPHLADAVLCYLKETSDVQWTSEINEGIVQKLRINIATTLKCWKLDAEAWDNPDQVVQDIVRCAPAWCQKGARNDWIWVQEDAWSSTVENDQRAPDVI